MTQELTNDHDMLVELRTEFRGMREDIRDLKDGTASRLGSLEKKTEDLETHKASRQDVEKIDARADRMRTTVNYIVGGLIVVNVAIPFIIYYLSK